MPLEITNRNFNLCTGCLKHNYTNNSLINGHRQQTYKVFQIASTINNKIY